MTDEYDEEENVAARRSSTTQRSIIDTSPKKANT
jgi:hypothetical protein